jgi:hypothetical protein
VRQKPVHLLGSQRVATRGAFERSFDRGANYLLIEEAHILFDGKSAPLGRFDK